MNNSAHISLAKASHVASLNFKKQGGASLEGRRAEIPTASLSVHRNPTVLELLTLVGDRP